MVEGKERLKLSMLKEQKELLRRIGEGNVSAGFRRVLGALESAVNVLNCAKFQKPSETVADYDDIFLPFIEAFNADSND
jgi:sugar diacid utilization regulator